MKTASLLTQDMIFLVTAFLEPKPLECCEHFNVLREDEKHTGERCKAAKEKVLGSLSEV